MKNGDKPIANPHIVLREEFDDWAILFDPDTGRGFGLSPTGVYLWKLRDGKHTLDALLQKMTHDFDNVPEPDEAMNHIGMFIDSLVAEGLVGLDSIAFRLGDMEGSRKRCSLGRAREAKPSEYDPPRMVDLRGKQIAHGDCGPGSGASGYCNPQGLRATSDCFQGSLDFNNCIGFGNSANHQCTANGSNASSSCSACGNNLGGGAYCDSGGSVNCYCVVGSAV